MIKDHYEGLNLMEGAVLSYPSLYDYVLCPSLWGPSLVLQHVVLLCLPVHKKHITVGFVTLVRQSVV